MKGDKQTKEQLLNELAELRRYVAELEKSENKGKRAKKAQLSSENFYKTIFENIITATAILGEDDTILLANKEFEQLAGYAREEVEGKKKWTEFVARKDELEQMKEYRRLRLIKPLSAPQKYEFQLVDRKGQVKDILTTIAKIPGKKQTLTTLLDITDRRRAEEALEKRIIALTQPLDDIKNIAFEDLFNLSDIQRLQDMLAASWGVAVLLTGPDGTAITQPSNFTSFCEFIRKSEKGLKKCQNSDAELGRYNPSGPIIHKCLSAGLWGAGASITAGGCQIASWLIGQVRNEAQSEEEIMKYAREIGVGDTSFREAFLKVPVMAQEKFEHIAHALFALANQLSNIAYQNIQQARFIAERKRVEQALRESQRKLSEARNIAQLGYWTWDVRTGKVEWSEEVFKIFQLDPNSFTPRIDSIQALSPWPEDHERDKELIQRAIESRERGTFEQRFLRPDKSTGYYFSSYQGVYDDVGNLISIVGTVQDITERKKAEDALRQSEEKFRGIYEESPLGIELYDREGTLLHVNRACLDIFGISDVKAVQGLKLFENPNLREECKAQLLRGESVRLEMPYDFRKVTALNWYETTKRDIIYLDILITPLRGSTKEYNIGYLVHTRDITDRKRAEKALQKSEEILRSVFKTTPVGLCIMKDRVFHSVNKTWLDICGYSESEIIGHTPRLLFEEEEEYERVGRELYTNLSESDLASVETKHRRKDGHIRDVILTAAPLHLGDVSFGMAIVTIEDITERKKAEEELRESEKKYRRLHESMMDAFVIVDMKGCIQESNHAYQSMLGYSEEELHRLTFTDITPGKWHALEKRIVEEQILVHGYSNVYEKEYQRKDGSVFPVELSTFLIRDDAENPVGLWAIVRDITGRKKMETELNAAKDYLNTVFNNVYDAILIHDLDGKVIDVNDKMLEMYRVSREEAIGLNILRDYSATAESIEESLSNWNKVMSGEHIFTEWKARRPKDGSVFDVEVFLTKLALPGGDYILANIRDITERKHAESALKESEKKYNQFFKTSRDCVFITKSGSLIDVNDAAVELLGYSSREELLQVKVPDLYAEPGAEAKHFRIIAECGYSKEYPVDFRRKDGSIRHTLVTSAARYDANGDLIGFQGTVRDVTGQRQNEEELRKYREKLEVLVAERTKELEGKTKNLEEVNTALNVLLKKRENDRKMLEENFVANIGSLVLPYLEKIRKNNLDAQQKFFLDNIEKNLDEIASPLLKNVHQFNLTPREIQIAYLIKDGKTTKEIATALGIVEGSISTHRKNIRKKLGLDRTSNLQSQLRFFEK